MSVKNRGITGAPIVAIVGGTLLLLWPIFPGGGQIHFRVMAMACFYGALAISWNIHALTGALSLGHAAFLGLGAYGSALASKSLGLSPYLSIPLGGAIAVLYALAWTRGFRNLREAAFALATLAAVEIPKVIVDNWDQVTAGSMGLFGIPQLPSVRLFGAVFDPGANLKSQYYLVLAVMMAAGYIHHKAINSRWGWAVRAVREDAAAASALGVDTHRILSASLILSAWMTGLCGGLYAHIMGLIEPGIVFGVHFSMIPLILSIFGGRYVWYGPVAGALILYPADQILFHSLLPAGHSVLYGLVIIVAMLFFPQGVGELIQGRIKSFSKSSA